MPITREELRENLELLKQSRNTVRKELRETVQWYGRKENVPFRVTEELRSRETRLNKQIARATIKLDKCEEPFAVRIPRTPKEQNQ